MTERATRSIEIEREIDGSADEVWDALTTDEGLRRWFPLDARVEPGVGGSVWLSWGPGVEAEAPIHVWEPARRFGWTESYGEDEAGRPIRVVVDFHLEGRAGTTVIRLVQSGLSADAEWDGMYDALVDGWTYFLFNLAHCFRAHRGRPRRMAWKRAATELGREAAWDRLVDATLVAAALGGGEEDGTTPGGTAARIALDTAYAAEIVSVRPGHHMAAILPELDDALIFVELEGAHIGFWLSTYGVPENRVTELQRALDERVASALAP